MNDEPIRVGILGAGSISDYHIVGLQEAGAEVVSIFSRSEARVREKAQRFGIPHPSTDPREILERDDIRAIVVATPDDTHEAMAVAAARAGKAIYLQKPMARTSEECRRIIAAANEAGVPLYVSWMHRYFDEVAKMRDLLAEGVLGKVVSIRQRNATQGPNWAAWFYSQEKVGGGVVLQLGTHGIDLIRYLFGEIESVKATTAITKEERRLADGSIVRPDNEDLAVAVYRLASGALVVHEMSFSEIAGTDRFRTEIYGERGTAWLRAERGLLSIYAPGYLGQEGWFQPRLLTTPFGSRQHRHFLAMLRDEEAPDSSAYDGLAAILVAEAIYRSASSNNWEEVRGV